MAKVVWWGGGVVTVGTSVKARQVLDRERSALVRWALHGLAPLESSDEEESLWTKQQDVFYN